MEKDKNKFMLKVFNDGLEAAITVTVILVLFSVLGCPLYFGYAARFVVRTFVTFMSTSYIINYFRSSEERCILVDVLTVLTEAAAVILYVTSIVNFLPNFSKIS